MYTSDSNISGLNNGHDMFKVVDFFFFIIYKDIKE